MTIISAASGCAKQYLDTILTIDSTAKYESEYDCYHGVIVVSDSVDITELSKVLNQPIVLFSYGRITIYDDCME